MLPAVEALDVLLRLMKLLGPSLPHILDAFQGQAERAGLRAVADVIVSANTDEAKRLIVQLVEHAEIKTSEGFEKVVVGHHFGNDLWGMLETFKFVLEVQFSDFFSAALRSPLLEAIFSQNTTSGDSPRTSPTASTSSDPS